MSASFTAGWIPINGNVNRYPLRTLTRNDQDERLAQEIVNKIETATISDKLDFFRSMGLEFNNGCDINCNDSNKNNNNACNQQTSGTSEITVESSENKPSEAVGRGSKSKQNHNSRDHKVCDMSVGCQTTIPLLRECRVTIIGVKCKTCGRNFKCITDLRLHTRRKHRAKKSRKKLVIKIGDEVIMRRPIKRKHLKHLHKQKQRTIDSSDDVASREQGEILTGQMSDEETTPFIDPDHNCDRSMITDAIPWPRLMDIENIEFPPQESSNEPSNETSILINDLANPQKVDDDEIEVLLKITRPRKSIDEMEINHETPNRSERERLLTDAIRDFVAMDDDLVEIIEPARDLQVYRDDSEIIEEYDNQQFGNLDGVEHNCSFHISNEDDIDHCPQDVNSLLPDNGNECFINDGASMDSPHYRNENGDIIPDFIDYTHCLNDRPTCYNNNNVGEFDSMFYNESQGEKWDQQTCNMRITTFDVQENQGLCGSLSLIKEEIMLDDLLL